jgi:hypothetical protein
LRQAFTRYYRALFEDDPKARSELLLHANLEIGLHEQTRLQPEIVAAMQASSPDPEPLARRIIATLYPARGEAALRVQGEPSPLHSALRRLLAAVRGQMRRVLTGVLMTLWVPPDVRLRLGRDLPATYPAALKRIASPDLRALLGQIDPTPDSLAESSALDWADLADRLHFICELFRCYHAAPELWAPPFAPEQVEALKAGRLPDGRL